MKLIVYCKKCSKEIKIKSTSSDRVELEKKLGKTFDKTCPHCNHKNHFHVNQVFAKVSVTPLLVFILSIICTFLTVWYFYTKNYLNLHYILYNGGLIPFAIIIPISIYFIINKNSNKKVSLFNRYKLSE